MLMTLFKRNPDYHLMRIITNRNLLELSSRPGLWQDAELPNGPQTAYPAVLRRRGQKPLDPDTL
jgi:hypothetical protein